MEVLLFLYVCPKVVLLNESNVALFPFRLHLVAEVLLFLYVYPHVVREVVKKKSGYFTVRLTVRGGGQLPLA